MLQQIQQFSLETALGAAVTLTGVGGRNNYTLRQVGAITAVAAPIILSIFLASPRVLAGIVVAPPAPVRSNVVSV
jgi:hypothetical protein